jgi:type III secretory pathway component EscU
MACSIVNIPKSYMKVTLLCLIIAYTYWYYLIAFVVFVSIVMKNLGPFISQQTNTNKNIKI